MIILGCDPGQSGGIAVIRSTELIEAHKMPETLKDLIDLLRSLCPISHCYLEKVHSMPGQGVASSFKFGYNFGSLEALICCAEIPYTKISPATWQKELGCLSGGDKKVTYRKAQELFPKQKISHAIADALLIAEYGRRIQSKSN